MTSSSSSAFWRTTFSPWSLVRRISARFGVRRFPAAFLFSFFQPDRKTKTKAAGKRRTPKGSQFTTDYQHATCLQHERLSEILLRRGSSTSEGDRLCRRGDHGGRAARLAGLHAGRAEAGDPGCA